jgi:hypothetical protein
MKNTKSISEKVSEETAKSFLSTMDALIARKKARK